MGDGDGEVLLIQAHLKLVAHADEAELPRLLLPVSAVVGVLKEFSDEAVLGLADQTLQRHVQGVVVLLHKLGLKKGQRGSFINRGSCLRTGEST